MTLPLLPMFKAPANGYRGVAAIAWLGLFSLLLAADAQEPAPPVIVEPQMFTAPEGLEVTVWATTPLLHNPTNIDFDQDGRLWIAEGVNYRGQSKRRKEGDRIVVLEDTDGNGKADRSDVFVQEEKFVAPLGIAVLDDKIIVSQPPDLIVYTDVDHDRKFDPAVDRRGTIYRVAPKGFVSKVPKFDLRTIKGQLEALRSPAVNVRHGGFTRLKTQGGKGVPAVAALLRDDNPFIAARAIWLLAQMGPAGVATVTPLLTSRYDALRLVAYRALRRAKHDVLAMAARMAGDPSAAIRREVALTMRDVPLTQSRAVLLEVAKRFDGKDRAYLEAFGLGCTGKEREIYRELNGALGAPPEQWSEAFAWLGWRLGSPNAVADFKARALSPKLNETQRKLMVDALAFVRSADAAAAMVELAVADDSPFHDYALWWLNNRKDNEWKGHGLLAVMKERGLIKEKPLVSVVTPELPADAPKLPPASEIIALQGDAERGKTAIAVCYTCHKIGRQGVEFGPDLTAFAKTQTREVITNAIVNPSAEISHGYEGSRVETSEGVNIDGIVMDQGDPLVIKSMGDQTQRVPRERIKAVIPLDRSLMFPVEMLGLTPQAVADIVAYLQSLP